MKKLILAAAMLSLSGGALANAGTITFTGAVTDQTCTIAVNGVADPTVVLQPATATSLSTAGSTAGLTTFNVQISGCTTSLVGVQFVPISANTTNNYLVNTATTSAATNVGFQLLNGSDVIPLSSANTADLKILQTVTGGGAVNATIPVGIQYYSMAGGATAGAVQSSIQYAITYQ